MKQVSARLWEELSGDGGLSVKQVGEKQRFHIEKYCGPRDQVSRLIQLQRFAVGSQMRICGHRDT